MAINMPGVRQTQYADVSDLIKQQLAGIQSAGSQISSGIQSGMEAANRQSDLRLADYLKGKRDMDNKLDNETAQQNRVIQADQYVKTHPGQGISLSAEGGVSVHAKDPMASALQKDRNEDRKARTMQSLIKNVAGDYNKSSGTSSKRVLAAQSVLKAIQDGDITSLGRIKAQLPVLEGENFKPTDAERELILQPTAAGAIDKLKNWLGGDSVGVSKSQIDALRGFTQRKVDEEGHNINRIRREVLQRYSPSLKNLSEEDRAALSSSLGMSNEELLSELASLSKPQKAAPPAPSSKSAPGFDPDAFLK